MLKLFLEIILALVLLSLLGALAYIGFGCLEKHGDFICDLLKPCYDFWSNILGYAAKTLSGGAEETVQPGSSTSTHVRVEGSGTSTTSSTGGIGRIEIKICDTDGRCRTIIINTSAQLVQVTRLA